MSGVIAPGLDDVCRLAEARTGLLIAGPSRPANLMRLEVARDAIDCPDWPAFAERLGAETMSGPSWTALIRSLLIGETYFFRNKPHFDLLGQRLLPALIERRYREEHPWLRIWSAGCATGEEAYSLAILVRELIPDPERWAIFILGTDLNSESLQRARLGSYRRWSFRDTDPDLMSRYTTQHGDDLVITDEVRKMVTFSPLNLVDDFYGSGPTAMDVILCRNVTMYFEQQTTKLVAKRLLAAVTPGGWLFVGPSEPDANVFAGFEAVNAFETTAYRRPQNLVEAFETGLPAAAYTETRPLAATLDGKLGRVPVLGTGHASYPATLEECLRAARLAADSGRYADARDLCCRALELDPTVADAYQLLGMIYAGQQEPELAVTAFRKAIYLERDFVLAHHGLSNELRLLGDETGATRSSDTARRLLRSLPAGSLLRGSHGITAQETRELLEPYYEGVPA